MNLASIQAYTGEEYREAGWLTLRFFGAQRCGATGNWTLTGHEASKGGEVCHTRDGESAGGIDLAGGWHDCGDHWMVCFTMGFSAYTLLKAYEVFPLGFTDRYKQRYTYSETMPEPDGDGIPDPINEAKVATDYFIKAIPDASTFYAECGDPDFDHKEWKTSAFQSLNPVDKGGDPRPVVKRTSGAGASCAQFTAALALMARLCPAYNMQTYADSCAQAAVRGYEYAKNNASSPYSHGGFYSESSEGNDDMIVAATELYLLTREERYLNDAQEYIRGKWESGWAYSWNSLWEAAYYNLLVIDPEMTNQSGKTVLTLFKGSYASGLAKKNGAGLCFYDGWGSCRYAGGLAFAMMLLYDISRTSEPAYAQQALELAQSQVDYILGDNEFDRSFIHGFGPYSWDKVHHRNLQGIDDNPPDAVKEATPFKFRRGGALIGGPSGQGQFENSVVNYNTTESGCDYNAGITGALAGLIHITAPYEPVAGIHRQHGFHHPAQGRKVTVTVVRKGKTISLAIKGVSRGAPITRLSLYDSRGALMAQRTASKLSWDIPALAAGAYVCAIKVGASSSPVPMIIP
ncbi:MAG: glycoside hydrolase family 9 protein [Chitinispirillaceae bacterium]|nr:glycoside hydrolase family 9 protein [Chitinispirillaceae bacterium]